jgi:Ca2+-binding RTX toxin-like protein
VAVQLAPDLLSGVEQSEWFIPTATPAAICSSHVFSTRGNLLFMGAYNAGTQVIDYSDPKAPKRVGYYIGDGTSAWGAYYYQGYIYQGDMSRGLDVLQFLGQIPGLDDAGGRSCPGTARSPRPQIVGTGGSDVLKGTSKSEIICGRAGKDVIKGGGGRDIIIAGGGNDKVNGGSGNDRLIGGGGNDRLTGGSGRDKCVGGKGADRGRCEKGKI